jgi:DNA-binding XRE family transcriptional regulator
MEGVCIVTRPKITGAYSKMQKDMGERIRWARQMVEPNRAAFARVLDVDRTTLHKIEDGERAPSVFLVAQLSHRLRVSTDYIILGTLRGVDGELAARLLEAHPELRDHSHIDGPVSNGNGSNPRPRRRGQAS